MTTLNMEEIDKTHFRTISLPDDSIYFGELAWIDQKGVLTGSFSLKIPCFSIKTLVKSLALLRNTCKNSQNRRKC